MAGDACPPCGGRGRGRASTPPFSYFVIIFIIMSSSNAMHYLFVDQ